MTIELKPDQERIIQAHLASGHFRSVEEVLATALANLPEARDINADSGLEAVRRMIEFAEKRFIQLPPGERIRDLIHEGHRY
jgi:Arc/MetJ-type ribon-helix-helix transcriptional regulator